MASNMGLELRGFGFLVFQGKVFWISIELKGSKSSQVGESRKVKNKQCDFMSHF